MSIRINPENPLGTMQSIEYATCLAKNLADYREQADKPFEHEARLKTLLAQQTQLNAARERRGAGANVRGAKKTAC